VFSLLTDDSVHKLCQTWRCWWWWCDMMLMMMVWHF